jgi:hypothetical protein
LILDDWGGKAENPMNLSINYKNKYITPNEASQDQIKKKDQMTE